jgi:hypothetical protein
MGPLEGQMQLLAITLVLIGIVLHLVFAYKNKTK